VQNKFILQIAKFCLSARRKLAQNGLVCNQLRTGPQNNIEQIINILLVWEK